MSDPTVTDLRVRLQNVLGIEYRLESELGGGGMSRVFRARDMDLERDVVIKVLPPELAAAVSVDRFKREILVSAGLQHPHIVPVLRAGEVEGLPYFIMPFITGESLRTRLGRGPLGIREVVAILRDVARALSHAHGNDVVHRDIKPDNILLTSGAAVVTDFGIAKAINASSASLRASGSGGHAAVAREVSTAAGLAIGTPAYMAPEQAAGDPATDHRADLYALGIVAWEMLTGVTPTSGLSPQQVMAHQFTMTPPSVATRRYDVPAALAVVIECLLQKDAARRPKYAADVIRMLEDPTVISGEPVRNSARQRTAHRRRTMFVVIAVVVAAVVMLVLVFR
jgi:eukaryotic-like serine/threonine-protein kinase